MTTDNNEQQARELLKRLVEVLNAKPGEQTSSVNAVMLLAQSFIERTEPAHPAVPAVKAWDEFKKEHIDLALGRSRDDRFVYLAGYRTGMEHAAEMVAFRKHDRSLCTCAWCLTTKHILDAAGKVPQD